MSQTIDLSSLDPTEVAENGAELELVHPVSNEPLGVFLTLAGKDSRKYRGADPIPKNIPLKSLCSWHRNEE